MSDDDELSLAVAVDLLRRMGYEIKPPPPPKPANTCVVCGRTDDENEEAGYGPLVDVLVVIADGEEGFANPLRYFCYEHLEFVSDGLIKLGFAVHRHGGINFLEPEDCPGYKDMDACPTPAGYDEELGEDLPD